MTWLKVDDKLTTHPKWLQLTLEAKALWFHAAVWCAAHNNDGIIPDEAMPLIAFSSSVTPPFDDAVARLVKARLWKRNPKAKGGGHEIVNWLDYQPSRQQVKDRAESDDRKEEMKRLHAWLHKKVVGKKVKAIIDARDGLYCRYCGERCVISAGDRRSAQRRTYDLVDPEQRWDIDAKAADDLELARLAAMWAISCGWCNSVKGHRTPDEAGLELLAPPSDRTSRTKSVSVRNGSGTVPVLGTGLSGSDQVGSVRVGSGLVGSGLVGSGLAAEPPEPPPPLSDEDIPWEDQR